MQVQIYDMFELSYLNVNCSQYMYIYILYICTYYSIYSKYHLKYTYYVTIALCVQTCL